MKNDRLCKILRFQCLPAEQYPRVLFFFFGCFIEYMDITKLIVKAIGRQLSSQDSHPNIAATEKNNIGNRKSETKHRKAVSPGEMCV